MNQQIIRGSQFASDNTAGMCPEALEAVIESNDDWVPSYGDDRWTALAADTIRDFFETDCEVFFVFNGTSANSLSLASLCSSFHSIICHELAHIETDECGGPEFFSHGTKLLTVAGNQGRMDPEAVRRKVTRRKDIHYPRPCALSITQSTEAGTVYTASKTRELCDLAHDLGLMVHMDGARLANALASLSVVPADITWRAGVDVLCFGGVKNGLACGEAVVFFNKEAAVDFEYRCKQAGQLASKMRFISAPWVKLLQSGAWLRNACHANEQAAKLCAELEKFDFLQIMYPCEANAVFLCMPERISAGLRKLGWEFHDFIGTGYSRLMCSWCTREEHVRRIVDDIASIESGS
ncbi:MAG: threonine aldolase family protein [Chitinispirillaceae bacterium]